jgi:hypothetical protein
MAPGLRRLYTPRPVAIAVGANGAPSEVDGVGVAAVREAWKVEDRWWAPRELRREYFELALDNGRAVVVFRCTLRDRWYRQRA